jgi:hypothetical protein
MWMVQRMPDCDMALVHDDDLEQILRVNNGTVSKDYAYILSLIVPSP